jgi:hypothetical protein
MAWAGKASGKQKTIASIKSRQHRRPLPPAENPLGISRATMKKLSQAQLPCDIAAYNEQLKQLLNGG